MTGHPAVTIAETPPSAPEARRVLRDYVSDVAGRYHGRPATAEEVDAALRDEPSDDLVPPDGLLLLAREHGAVLGCAGLRLIPGGIGELTRVFVHHAARGRGIASALLRELEARARARGVHTLRLDTRSDLVEARALYLRHGYTEIEPYTEGPYVDHCYAKRLTTGGTGARHPAALISGSASGTSPMRDRGGRGIVEA
ncbi:GNAT family N-acetyltransferase [Prauserella muralis]|uniref:Uncharacterized protein n=1 Tax=Prauserella muralis TaxID=588067 RepID=A0A2V4AND7_9PSEU|nr:GNAT family N-acetyltransferase [Prauserella muralis]PXY22220.1 hypothetical protein BAY60_20245 [Prauserella muralis]TWE27852.1 acetyltransferase (GNAT) family protein [Prauserella muralis]